MISLKKIGVLVDFSAMHNRLVNIFLIDRKGILKILILGYFGYITNQIDGQTVKTRDVYTLLKQNCKEDVEFFDTESFKKSKFNLFKMFFRIFRADILFYLPAHNNLKYLFPLIFLLSKFSNTKINYLVVGGWLSNFLKNKPIHKYMLRKINGIYVETNSLLLGLKSCGFKNLNKLYNFRVVDFPKIYHSNFSEGNVKLVFMARVQPMKGVDILFEIDKRLTTHGIKNVSIDIYGHVLKSYEQVFFNKLENSNINYRGVLEPDDIYDTLQAYDIMLFPTKYYTEGFPGTILDAYISGIPVVVTKWLNAEEFVSDGETGLIVEFGNDEVFVEKVLNLIKQPHKINEFKKNTLLRREEYNLNSAWNILYKSIK